MEESVATSAVSAAAAIAFEMSMDGKTDDEVLSYTGPD